MSKIFISYRRDDSKNIVGRIYDHLAHYFDEKNIFKDVDSIPLGSDFREVIEKSVQSCDVILVVIGEKWLNILDSSGNRRIDDLDDFVRIEIEAGLNREIPIIPVLLSDVKIPNPKSLPNTLKALAFKNGISVRPDPDFKNDINKLIKALDILVNNHPKKQPSNKKKYIGTLFLIILISTVYFTYSSMGNKGISESKAVSNEAANDIKNIVSNENIFQIDFEESKESLEISSLKTATYNNNVITFHEWGYINSQRRIIDTKSTEVSFNFRASNDALEDDKGKIWKPRLVVSFSEKKLSKQNKYASSGIEIAFPSDEEHISVSSKYGGLNLNSKYSGEKIFTPSVWHKVEISFNSNLFTIKVDGSIVVNSKQVPNEEKYFLVLKSWSSADFQVKDLKIR